MWYNISHHNANERKVTSTPAPVLTTAKEVLTMADKIIHSPVKSSKPKTQCICAYCQKTFTTFPSRIKRGGGKYCSVECHNAAQTLKVKCNCNVCGKEIVVKRLRYVSNISGNYCSLECFRVYQKQNYLTLECLNCKNIFFSKPSKVKYKRNFCSRKCHREYSRGENSLLYMGGGIRYRGVNWRKQRDAAHKRDGGVCQYCHHLPRKGSRLNAVHHIKPFRTFNGDYIAANDLSNLITLCHTCHRKAESGVIPVPKRLL